MILHGLLRSIVLDRDIRFGGHFWRALWKKMRKNLGFSSTYLPYKDGKTKVINRSLGNNLRSLVYEHPKKWDQALPQAEFASDD